MVPSWRGFSWAMSRHRSPASPCIPRSATVHPSNHMSSPRLIRSNRESPRRRSNSGSECMSSPSGTRTTPSAAPVRGHPAQRLQRGIPGPFTKTATATCCRSGDRPRSRPRTSTAPAPRASAIAAPSRSRRERGKTGPGTNLRVGRRGRCDRGGEGLPNRARQITFTPRHARGVAQPG